jgi:excisionase family DNA binding protein
VRGRLFTARELAELLSLSVETVLRWTRRGELPAVRLPGGAIRYREPDIDEWIERRVTATPVREAPASLSDAAAPRVSSTPPASPPLDAATTEEAP